MYQDKMSPEMYRELRSFMLGFQPEVSVVRVKLNGDYDKYGRYFGSCARGERIHRVWAQHGHKDVRSRLTAAQLRKLCAQLTAA